MLETQTYLGAFVVGLLGGVHCAGMCGGIISALTLGVKPASTPASRLSMLSYLLSYNLARITSYTLMGLAIGGLGVLVTDLVFLNKSQVVLKVIAGVFMILLGLYLANWWRVLTRVEQLGSVVWKYIEPLAHKVIPIKNIPQAFVAGLVWGWLPCGLVYSVLVWSMSSGSALNGGLLMLSFGLGTLPNLIAMGVFATAMRRFMQTVWVRHVAGLLVIGFGVYQIAVVL